MKTTVQRHERPVLPTPSPDSMDVMVFPHQQRRFVRTNISPLTPSLCHAGPVASPEEGGGLTARESGFLVGFTGFVCFMHPSERLAGHGSGSGARQ